MRRNWLGLKYEERASRSSWWRQRLAGGPRVSADGWVDSPVTVADLYFVDYDGTETRIGEAPARPQRRLLVNEGTASSRTRARRVSPRRSSTPAFARTSRLST